MIENIVFGLGSNKGNRLKNLNKAVKKISLNNGFNFLALSGVFETEPWGFKNQNNFLNCILVCLCRIKLPEVPEITQKIEKSIGRIKRAKWQPREIDIDILFYGSRIYSSNKLKVPHPLIQKRNFELKPLAEIMPEFIHPELNKSIKKLYKSSKDTGKVSVYKKTV